MSDTNSTKPQKRISKLKLLFILATVLLITSFGSASFIVVKSIQNNNKKSDEDTIRVDGLSNDIVESLTKQLVYSNNSQGEGQYYSPSLDALIKYPQSKFKLNDNTSSLSITLKNDYAAGVYGIMSYLPSDDLKKNETVSAFYEQQYKTIYNAKKVEVKNLDGIDFVKFEYQRADYLNKDKKITNYKNIYSKKLDNRYLILEFQYNNAVKIDSISNDLLNIIKTAEISPKDIETEILVQAKKLNLEAKIDKKKWNVQSASDTYISLDFRNKENEVKEEYKSIFATLTISGRETSDYEKFDEAYFKKQIDNTISYAKDNDKFKILSQNIKKQIAGIDFYELSYSSDSFGSITYQAIYFGYDSSTKVLYELRSNTGAPDSEGAKEVQNILFNKLKKIPSTSNRGIISLASNNIQKINLNSAKISQAANIKTANTTTKKEGQVLGTSTAEIDKSSILGKPGVVHIFNRTCLNIKVSKDKSLKKSSGKTYNVCTGGFGTGFFVNKDGYLVTNSHVAKPNLTDALISSLGFEDNKFLAEFGADVLSILASQKVVPKSDEEAIYFLLQGIVSSVDENVITITGDYENYIEGTENFNIDPTTIKLKNEKDHKKAELIFGNDIDSFSKMQLSLALGEKAGITVPDITILKIEPENGEVFPALKLADPELINSGQQIQAIGFPAAADNKSLFSENSSVISTITKGNVSAIKPNFNNEFNLIQIDASISPGNSGGPIINSDGEVVGVATYGVSAEQSADFNAGVSVEEVIKLLEDNNINNDLGEVSTSISNGIENFNKKYYKRSLEDFNKAKSLYTASSDVLNPLIKISEAKIESGEDKTPAVTFGSIELSSTQVIVLSLLICLSLLGFFLITLILIIVLVRRSRRKKMAKQIQSTPISVEA